MIELIILNHLKSKLSEMVVMEKDETMPNAFVLMEKTGSGETNHIASATFAFQSYSKNSLFEAAELNEKVKQAVKDLIELDAIASVKLNTDYNFTDTTTKEYRYQAIFDLKY